MRVHWLQHVPFEGLGSIEPWLAARGADVTVTRLFEAGARLPHPRDVEWVVAMGGPMSVNDEAALPWLAAEKRFVADAIAAEKTVLGICLGAQLIASALGAAVRRNAEREIGWFEITPTAAAANSALAPLITTRAEVFHWHGEIFDLPPGATLLAASAACAHQAFALGPRVLGVQFHLETTPESAQALVEHCPDDLAPARWVQAAPAILVDAERFRRINRLMSAVLDALADG